MNANDRPNRFAKAAQTKLWREAGKAAAAFSTAPRMTGLVRIVATVHISDNRRREVSNLFPTFKAIVDGFVDAGLIEDDSDRFVIGPDPRRGYDVDTRIVFTLTQEDPCPNQ